MEARAGCYTLLADDNSQFSNSRDRRAEFKAHLVYNIILNGTIVFSDNQVLCSSNLQSLVAHDRVTLALLEEGFFDLAIRQDFDGEPGVASLARVHDAFVRERKIRHAAKRFEDTPALALIDRHAGRIPWPYGSIRTNYSDNCRRLLLREFEPLLTSTEFERFRERIETGESDRGLGREFLQNNLPDEMTAMEIAVDDGMRQLIRRCTDAPYLSNLPSLIGLNPIYADEHRASFDLMRGRRHQLEATDAERTPCRFDYEHYVKGLCSLTLDDIRSLQDLPSRQTYLRLSDGGIRAQSDYDEAFRAFREFNLLVEDRIASRFPEIARASSGDPDRSFIKQKAREYGKAAAEDVTGILIGWAVKAFPLSLCRQVLIDVRAWVHGEQPRQGIGIELLEHDIVQKRLDDHLKLQGEDRKLRVEDRSNGGSPFAKEIIVS